MPLHLQPAFRSQGYGRGDFPIAEAAANRILSLPLYPHITPEQQRTVAGALLAALTLSGRLGGGGLISIAASPAARTVRSILVHGGDGRAYGQCRAVRSASHAAARQPRLRP